MAEIAHDDSEEDDVGATAGVSIGEHRAVGNYRIVRPLGQGGMGAVYEAVHQRIGSRAAIKVLHPHLAQRDEVALRFLNEARAVNIVSHPGLVNIFEFDQLPDRTVYIVMEYLAGETLGRRLRRCPEGLGPLALPLARQVASAVAAAHDKGIVHRDLKPDNVMLVSDPEIPGGERTKVLDFGIAKLMAVEGGPTSSTRTGAMLGTPLYMSPEQCRGNEAISDRADVYSLGIMLYQMITGRPPFDSDSSGELIALHLLQQPPPLEAAAPWTAGDLAALLRRMLSKEPARRPSMLEVADALQRIQGAGALTGAMPAVTGAVLAGAGGGAAAMTGPGVTGAGAAGTEAAAVAATGADAAPGGVRWRQVLAIGGLGLAAAALGWAARPSPAAPPAPAAVAAAPATPAARPPSPSPAAAAQPPAREPAAQEPAAHGSAAQEPAAREHAAHGPAALAPGAQRPRPPRRGEGRAERPAESKPAQPTKGVTDEDIAIVH